MGGSQVQPELLLLLRWTRHSPITSHASIWDKQSIAFDWQAPVSLALININCTLMWSCLSLSINKPSSYTTLYSTLLYSVSTWQAGGRSVVFDRSSAHHNRNNNKNSWVEVQQQGILLLRVRPDTVPGTHLVALLYVGGLIRRHRHQSNGDMVQHMLLLLLLLLILLLL